MKSEAEDRGERDGSDDTSQGMRPWVRVLHSVTATISEGTENRDHNREGCAVKKHQGALS